MNIKFVHLLDNFTGSPRMLANILEIFKKDSNLFISVITSKTNGFISKVKGIKIADKGSFLSSVRTLTSWLRSLVLKSPGMFMRT